MVRLLTVLVTSLVWSTGSHAQSEPLASAWVKGMNSKVRLTGAFLLKPDNSLGLYAGVDIKLGKNWKTYWKAPGNGGGVPPSFDWSGSQNVKAVQVQYPTPRLYKGKYGDSIGYKDKVLFPVAVVPEDAGKPVALRLNLFYGVCDDICVPAEASLALDVAPGARAAINVQRELMAALGKLPDEPGGSLMVTETKARLSGTDPYLMIKAKASDVLADVDLFAIASDGRHVPMAQQVGRTAAGETIFRIDLKRVNDVASFNNLGLELTVVSNGRSISVPWTISTKS